jgi:hypothetical protein
MGRIKQGANGGFSGKAGSVIGSSWKGIDYIKGRPKTSSKPASQRQLEQQAKFRLAVNFLKPIKDLLNSTCVSLSQGRAMGFNMALKQVLAEAVIGDYPDYSIDYAAVKLAYGPLAIAKGSVVAEAGGVLKVTWSPQLNKYNAFGDDEITVLIYDPETNIYTHGLDGITRAAAEMDITLDAEMISQTLEIYYFFTDRDGKKISPSRYAGEVVVI